MGFRKPILSRIIKGQVEKARLQKTMAATCAYLCLKYYNTLKDLHPDDAPEFFNQTPSWTTEFRKHMALGKLLEQKGVRLS